MYPLGVAGFLIAFVATAGAIPLFRSLFRRCSPMVYDPAFAVHVPSTPPVAGAAMLFGLLLSFFYLDVSLDHATDLFVATSFVTGCAALLEHAQAKRGSLRGGSSYEVVASVVAALGIILASRLSEADWTPTVIVVVALIGTTSAAMSSLSRSPGATPALPTGVCLVQFLLLALLATLSVPGGTTALGMVEDFSVIALPLCGAAIGALLYLCRMPWRPDAAIKTGLAARLCLGLAVAWGACRLWGALETNTQAQTAIAWILAVPVLELLRLAVSVGVGSTFSRRGKSPAGDAVASIAYSPVSITSFTLVLGLTGIAFYKASLPELKSLALLIPALLTYLAWPTLIRPLKFAHRTTFLDAEG